MKKLSLIAVVSIIWILTSGFSIVRYDGPYKGKVVDADTGEPIEGVVVLGVWYTEFPTPAGPQHRFYDARETVADKNGEFEIEGMGLRVLSNLEPMNVTIFKAGYSYLDVPWESLKKGIRLRKIIKWEDDKPIIPLKKLTMEERRKRIISTPNIPDQKMKLLTREVNKEYLEAKGFSPYREVE